MNLLETYNMIPCHGFTVNKAYCSSKAKGYLKETYVYTQWKTNIQAKMEDLPTLEELQVDPYTPMRVDIVFWLKDGTMDVNNFVKSFLDALETHYKKEVKDFDDVNFIDVRATKLLTYCDSFDKGQIFFKITNLTPDEILTLSFTPAN